MEKEDVYVKATIVCIDNGSYLIVHVVQYVMVLIL